MTRGRIACVDVPALPMQIVLHAHPAWRSQPVVVVDSLRAQGIVTHVNELARKRRILPGQRYAQALSLARNLQADVVSEEQVHTISQSLLRDLLRCSPNVQQDDLSVGLFWLDGEGLEHEFRDVIRAQMARQKLRRVRCMGTGTSWGQTWVAHIAERLETHHLQGTVVGGFSRMGTFAWARAHPGQHCVWLDVTSEQEAIQTVPLACLDLPPAVRDDLALFGITTIGDLLQLPPQGLRERWGAVIERFHQAVSGTRMDPVLPTRSREPDRTRLDFDSPEDSLDRLLFRLKPALDTLLARLATQHTALSSLSITLTSVRFQQPPRVQEHTIRPANPTLEARTLLSLLHLRLQSVTLDGGIVRVDLDAESTRASHEQLQLFAQRPRRDPRVAEQALARVRAELGDHVVVRAVLREGHLPEARFSWALYPPTVRTARPLERSTHSTLVRRLYQHPVSIPRNVEVGTAWSHQGDWIRATHGPYIVSGGWWVREVHRAYAYVETAQGAIHWVYFDRRRGHWLLHGTVE